MMKLFGCRKFKRLSYVSRDRELKSREEKFLSRHRELCPTCSAQFEPSLDVFSVLQSCAMEPEVRPNFDEKVLRRVKAQTVRTSLKYWSPAVIGAAVASLVVLAALQMIAQSSHLPTISVPGGEAMRTSPKFPSLLETASYRHIIQQ